MTVQNVASQQKRFGFSLVELVSVIVIIGIIAAIAIPRVGRGAKGAGESALAQDLAVLRNAIELYASQHGGDYPGAKADSEGNAANSAAAFVTQLTMYTGEDGSTSANRDAAHPYGPYLRKGIPPAPVGVNKGSTDVLMDTTNSPPNVVTAGGEGWAYNPTTGDIIVNSDANNDAGTKTYDAY